MERIVGVVAELDMMPVGEGSFKGVGQGRSPGAWRDEIVCLPGCTDVGAVRAELVDLPGQDVPRADLVYRVVAFASGVEGSLFGAASAEVAVYCGRMENRIRHRNRCPSSVKAWTASHRCRPVVGAGSRSPVYVGEWTVVLPAGRGVLRMG
ncbi:hypothetical protein GCM10009727_45770 [Actinomadura napierensis]|uniref:Uncharacterized protein n=1 Tax=Actinomadura napierensis TaxID=267854 RepID=A0ABP5LF31_9ACTN